MRGFIPFARRGSALVFSALLLVLAGCDGDRSLPTAPTGVAMPPSPPSSWTLAPSEEAIPGTFERVTAFAPQDLEFHGGRLDSRLVFEGNGRFRLQYDSATRGAFEYEGSYAREGSLYLLDFDGWSITGPWLGAASFGAGCVRVEHNAVMQMDDFENAEYCL